MRSRLIPLLMALGAFVGLSFINPAVPPASAQAGIAWVGNGWSQPIGVWDQNNNLWYPIASGSNTSWTLDSRGYTAVNFGPHSYCRIHYFGAPASTTWTYFNNTSYNFHYHLSEAGLTIVGCAFVG